MQPLLLEIHTVIELVHEWRGVVEGFISLIVSMSKRFAQIVLISIHPTFAIKDYDLKLLMRFEINLNILFTWREIHLLTVSSRELNYKIIRNLKSNPLVFGVLGNSVHNRAEGLIAEPFKLKLWDLLVSKYLPPTHPIFTWKWNQ